MGGVLGDGRADGRMDGWMDGQICDPDRITPYTTMGYATVARTPGTRYIAGWRHHARHSRPTRSQAMPNILAAVLTVDNRLFVDQTHMDACITPRGKQAHQYGAESDTLIARKTIMGTFLLCPACDTDCFETRAYDA